MINYTVYYKDLGSQAVSRILSVAINDCQVLQPTLSAQVTQLQEAYNQAFLGVLEAFTVESAEGVQLDIIGRIVGQPRPYVDGNSINFFTLDLYPIDSFPCFVTGLNAFDVEPASDYTYRLYIKGKILKNHVQWGSTGEVLSFVKQVFGLDISIQKTQFLAVELLVPSQTAPSTIDLLGQKINNDLVTYDYFLPFGTGVKIQSIITLPSSAELPPFILDVNPMDSGLMMTGYPPP